MSVTDRDSTGDGSGVHGEEELVAILDEGEAGVVCTIAPAVTTTDDEAMSRWISAADEAFVDLAEMG